MSNIINDVNKLIHTPVMLKEVIEYLLPKDNNTYLDTTFGAGGYSRGILETCNRCKVFAIDQDPTTIKHAKILEQEYGDRFKFANINFGNISKLFNQEKFDGIVMDLGVSSMQLDTPERGFSFSKDGPLDMRMSNDGLTAEELINTAAEEELANIIFQYGEERDSRKIAKNIVLERNKLPIKTTLKLAEIIHQIKPNRGKIDSATKTFQAIRIYINNELGQLTEFLNESLKLLAPEGRLVVVSFHSLEDRIVKNFIKENSSKKVHISKYPSYKATKIDDSKLLESLVKRPLTPSLQEIKSNPRSRSAKLRVVKKLGRINEN